MDHVFEVHIAARKAMHAIAKSLTLDQLNHIPDGFNNNIAWNLGHIVAVEQLLIYGLCKVPYNVEGFIVENFRGKTKPEGSYTQEQIDTILDYFAKTGELTQRDYKAGLLNNPTPFISKSTDKTYESIESIITFNIFHEGLHTGVIQKYIQLLSKV